jgi:hypothetical protein
MMELPELALTGEGISALLAFVLALALELVPGLKEFWENFSYKRALLAGAGLIVAFAILGLDYAGVIDVGAPEPFVWAGLVAIMRSWLVFAGGLQLTYSAAAGSLPRNKFQIIGK